MPDYFVETAAYHDVLATRNTVFVGRKGSGKTANMYQAATELDSDTRNLVVVIKPPSYEFASLLRLVEHLQPEMQQYSIQALWQFLLSSQIAARAIEVIQARPAHLPLSDAERALIAFAEKMDFGLNEDFGTRFEQTVAVLASSNLSDTSTIAEGRDTLNELLHSEAIRRLRALLGPVLKDRRRVALLIDNLDKAWEKSTDLETLSKLLLGLFVAQGRLSTDFSKDDHWRNRIALTLATFLRADIWNYVRGVAREPDKVPVSRVEWTDKSLLLRVVEERYLAARPEGSGPDELWTEYFAPTVRGQPTREYLLSRCLPRPRDLIYFCNAAISSAVNGRRGRVEEVDVCAGEAAYSQFAFEALLVENGITIEQLEDILFEFAGEPAVMGGDRLLQLINRVAGDDTQRVIDRLRALSFLGIEVRTGEFDFWEFDPSDKRAAILARKVSERTGQAPRYSVHAAYRAYLEIEE